MDVVNFGRLVLIVIIVRLMIILFICMVWVILIVFYINKCEDLMRIIVLIIN